MNAVLDIARVNLLRSVRDRTSLFFVFLLPIVIIVALGTVYGGFGTSRLGVVHVDSGELGAELLDAVRSGELAVDVVEFASVAEMQEAVESRDVEAGLIIPAGFDAELRAGRAGEITLVTRPEDAMSAIRQAVDAAVAGQSARIGAARLAMAHAGADFDAALGQARSTQAALPELEVRTVVAGTSVFPSDAGSFSFGAQSQLILFMFLTSMTAATGLVLTRELGVSKRMLATRTPVRAILLGEVGGRFAVAMMQGLFIVLVSTLLFGVAWGDLVGAAYVVVVFALIGTGAAMIVGVFARNADQAGAIGVVFGMVLGAVGGAMVPAELFDEPMSTIARLTPHAWAIDALRDLAFRGAGLADILTQLAVLTAFAVGVLLIGVWGMRRSLTR